MKLIGILTILLFGFFSYAKLLPTDLPETARLGSSLSKAGSRTIARIADRTGEDSVFDEDVDANGSVQVLLEPGKYRIKASGCVYGNVNFTNGQRNENKACANGDIWAYDRSQGKRTNRGKYLVNRDDSDGFPLVGKNQYIATLIIDGDEANPIVIGDADYVDTFHSRTLVALSRNAPDISLRESHGKLHLEIARIPDRLN